MLTKYILYINGTAHELQDDDLRNWDEISCTYKRESYDGIVRSFTSQFEFVNDAYYLLRNAYLSDRLGVEAVIEVLTANDRLEYESQFACPLDLSSIEWDDSVLYINAVDNSLAALIKANNSTKYQFIVGSELPISKTLRLTRIPMTESLTYKFTQGESDDDSADILVEFNDGELPWLGNTGDEVLINLTIAWNDDQESDGGFLFKVLKDTKLKFTYGYSYRSNESYGGAASFALRVRRDMAVLPINISSGANGCHCGTAEPLSPAIRHNFGTFSSSDALPDISAAIWSADGTRDLREKGYAIKDGIVWESTNAGWTYIWKSSGKIPADYFIEESSGGCVLELKAGDVVFMEHTIDGSTTSNIKFTSSEFKFEWTAIGEDVTIGVHTPAKVAKALLLRIADGNVNPHVEISDFDERIKHTYLMAAESIRAISGANFYSSFSEFCDWMSTVFGYVYYIGDTKPSPYTNTRKFGKIVSSPYGLSGSYLGEVDVKNILYDPKLKRFFYADNGYFMYWSGWENYNDSNTRTPRTDTIFVATDTGGDDIAYVFGNDSGKETLDPVEYDDTDEPVGENDLTVYFVHRSELMSRDADVVAFANCRNLKYSLDSSVIYSSVTIGYESKDYDSANGRDEFNFSNTYTTGCSVSDSSLSLISKYRADSYGIEFAVQKRTQDTTDTTSDNDVFFILCREENGGLIADRTANIENALSTAVFNGAFSPLACVRANEGYLGLMAQDMVLKFASSTGNSDVKINGESISADIRLDSNLATCGIVEFSTDDVTIAGRSSDLMEVSSGGLLYRGFLKETDIKYARNESAQIKMIVTDIEEI